ncbi:MAG: ABC transporter ATP-binding protein [Lachnospiraceae bacterium]|jgi:ABC-2 type transport system ATP-binding protein|nr:ABC transporter ATP-binding protein [Lachnospiraceae bacterium]
MNYLLEANCLYKRYDSKKAPALNGLTLNIPSGRIVGLLGPNGSGKTTFIKLINGLLTPTSGTVTIGGMTPGTQTKSLISYLPERTCLQSSMKIEELVSFFADFYPDFSSEKAYHMFSSLHINPSDKLKTLSKGTREKVQLILVMSRDAQLYILDEPIAGVDPAARDYILKTIISNYNENATILISTHLISDIENILDDVIFIREGNVFLYASAEAIREEKGKSLDAYFREVFTC